MKNILIIYPHWPPSNLAGIHRARLISNFLPEFGWHPIVLTVKPQYYEENPDTEIIKTVRPTTEVIHVDAHKVTSANRLIGDIGLRAFSFLKTKALELLKERKIDFIWIPIPSFYVAVLGRQLHAKTSVPYGIDYIDPWVDSFVGQEKFLTKAWLSNQVSKLLEPYAVKNAALISGVSTPYYQDVLDRNFKNKNIVHVGMPYGFDPKDHDVKISDIAFPWDKFGDNIQAYIYAGAFLPKSHFFLVTLFKSIQELDSKGLWDKKKKLFFVGTGKYPGKTISEYALDYNLNHIVKEIPDRFPFLHILNFLSAAAGVIVLGSTEKHYTASKIFQSLLSKRPVLAAFHHQSSAVEIMQEVKADKYLIKFDPNEEKVKFQGKFKKFTLEFFTQELNWNPDLEKLEPYSAKKSAEKLVKAIEKIN